MIVVDSQVVWAMVLARHRFRLPADGAVAALLGEEALVVLDRKAERCPQMLLTMSGRLLFGGHRSKARSVVLGLRGEQARRLRCAPITTHSARLAVGEAAVAPSSITVEVLARKFSLAGDADLEVRHLTKPAT